MKRFTWWRMEQDAHHLSRALCGALCSILHHVKRFMSQPPNSVQKVSIHSFRALAGKFNVPYQSFKYSLSFSKLLKAVAVQRGHPKLCLNKD